jgi:glycosyltransferase involved in cell wall biosynthesis
LENKPTIAVNARFLLPGKLEGIGWYSYETIKRLIANHPEYHFELLFDRKPDPSFCFPGSSQKVLGPQARHPFLWYAWFEWSVKNYLKKEQPVLFLSPDGYACLGTEVPQLIVMHDLAFEHFPEQVPGLVRAYYKKYMPLFARKASAIATVSGFSKQDIVKRYGIDEEKITVTYNGANELYHPLTEEEVKVVRARWTDGQEYLVYVGSMHPRKNVDGLLKAFEMFKQRSDSKVKLLLVGRMAWQTGSIKGQLDEMKFRDDVVFTGHLDPTDLKNALGGALALTYVSWFEGFGIPILEAMQMDVPVLCSNTSSMPEVAGEAALVVNPGSTEDISMAMQRLVEDKALRELLILKGREQREKFSWDKTAEKLWEAMASVLRSQPRV